MFPMPLIWFGSILAPMRATNRRAGGPGLFYHRELTTRELG